MFIALKIYYGLRQITHFVLLFQNNTSAIVYYISLAIISRIWAGLSISITLCHMSIIPNRIGFSFILKKNHYTLGELRKNPIKLDSGNLSKSKLFTVIHRNI